MSTVQYKARLSGSTTGAKSGILYRFDAGDEFACPAGEFDHDPDIQPVAEKKKTSSKKEPGKKTEKKKNK